MSIPFTVEGKVCGQKVPVFSDWHIELPPIEDRKGDHLRLRDLITSLVIKEVDAYRGRQQERNLVRIMSKKQIEKGVLNGKVDSGGRDLKQTVNIEEATATALQAFEDGLYFVFIDEVQQTDLDAEVFIKANSKVLFLRLTALVGG